MPNSGSFEAADPSRRAREQLRQMAEALDCSIDAFTSNPRLRDDLASAAELLQLWAKIERIEDRERLLRLVRECSLSR